MKCKDKENAHIHSDDARKQKSKMEEYSAPDGGWGWLVVLGAFVSHMILDGSIFACGIFYVEILDYFQSGSAETSWISSIASGMCFIGGPVGGYMVGRLGCRITAIIGSSVSAIGFVASMFATDIYLLFFTLGGLAGFGFSLMLIASSVCVGWYFEKRRSFATGLTVCGSGVGTFVLAPFTQWLIQVYGWKGAILVLGGVVANGIICGMTYVPVKLGSSFEEVSVIDIGTTDANGARSTSVNFIQEKRSEIQMPDVRYTSNMSMVFARTKSSEKHVEAESLQETNNNYVHECQNESFNNKLKQIFRVDILTDSSFVMWSLHGVVVMMGYLTIFLFLPRYAITLGHSPQKAAFLISIIGICNTISRVLVGYICDFKSVAPHRLQVYSSCLVVGGLAVGMVAFCESYALLATCAAVYGTSFGRAAIVTPLMVDLFGLKKLAVATGYKNLALGIPLIVAPPFTGWIFEVTDSFPISFGLSGAFIASGGCIMFLFPLVKACCKRQKL